MLSGTIPLAKSASCSLLAKVKRWHGSSSFALADGSGSFELADGSGSFEQELLEGSGSVGGWSLAIVCLEAQSVHSHIPRQKGETEYLQTLISSIHPCCHGKGK